MAQERDNDNTAAPQLPAPGWYPDPAGAGQRWWDGERWTEQVGDPPLAPMSQPDPLLPSSPAAAPQPLGFGAKALLVVVVLALLGGVSEVAGCSGSTDVAVIGHNCIPNGDGSVHVQGELRNDGSHDETAIIEFTLTLYGGETETSKPFGGYSVPAGETSLVGEDLNVPPGAEWADCSVEVLG